MALGFLTRFRAGDAVAQSRPAAAFYNRTTGIQTLECARGLLGWISLGQGRPNRWFGFTARSDRHRNEFEGGRTTKHLDRGSRGPNELTMVYSCRKCMNVGDTWNGGRCTVVCILWYNSVHSDLRKLGVPVQSWYTISACVSFRVCDGPSPFVATGRELLDLWE